MSFHSPYLEDRTPQWPSPKVRAWISRGTMAAIGFVMLYFSWRGVAGLIDIQRHAATMPSSPAGFGRSRRSVDFMLWPWLLVIGLGVFGAATLAAAILPLSTMQALFEKWNVPPVTGDRSGSDPWRWFWWDWW